MANVRSSKSKLFIPTPAEIRQFSAGDTNQTGVVLSVTQLKLRYGELPVVAFGMCTALFNQRPTNFLKVLVVVKPNEYHAKLLFATKGIHDQFMMFINPQQFPSFVNFTEEKTKKGKKSYFRVDYMPVAMSEKHMWVKNWKNYEKTLSYPEGVKQVFVLLSRNLFDL